MVTRLQPSALAALASHFHTPSPLERLAHPWIKHQGVELWVKRDDLIHPVISGNKWRKLKYPLAQLLERGYQGLVTFGGAYSNHLYACAKACALLGLPCVGIVRGGPYPRLNSTLQYCQDQGMRLIYWSREHYRNKEQPAVQAALAEAFPHHWLLAEGGANPLALGGVSELLEEIEQPFDLICSACGTGTTAAGLIAALKPEQRYLGISVLKGGGFLYPAIEQLLAQGSAKPHAPWRLRLEDHHGGYAKSTPALQRFIAQTTAQTGLPLEPIYTGKALYGLFKAIEAGEIAQGQRVIFLHTGGRRELS